MLGEGEVRGGKQGGKEAMGKHSVFSSIPIPSSQNQPSTGVRNGEKGDLGKQEEQRGSCWNYQ